MKNIIITAICCSTILTSCQQTEEFDNETLPMSIEASIEGNHHTSRHAGDNNTLNNLDFKQGDAIGMFVNEQAVVEWSKQSNSEWKAANSIYWPNKFNEHNFYAYHPYIEASSKESVPMPSLSNQTGNIEDLCAFDFLVATTKQSYETSATVSFTGEDNGFQHVSSLISITIKGNSDLKSSTINNISFEGENIASSTTYSFISKEVSITSNGTSNKLNSSTLNHTMNNTDKTFYFIANAGEELSDITINIEYSTGNTNYTASKRGLGNATLISGNLYKFNLNIIDGILGITGNTIQPWTEQTMDDIIINTPTKQ